MPPNRRSIPREDRLEAVVAAARQRFQTYGYKGTSVADIAGDVGVNAEIIRHGVDGFICRTDTEWIDALRTLLHDPALRQRMGEAGRQRIVDAYSVRSQAPRIAAAFRQLAGTAPQP